MCKFKEIIISSIPFYCLGKKTKIVCSELPIVSGKVMFNSINPGETKVIIAKKCKGIIVYKFLMPSAPPPITGANKIYIIAGGATRIRGSISIEYNEASILISMIGPGGNGGTGGSGGSATSHSGGGGGGGGSGGYSSSYITTTVKSGVGNTINYSIGFPSDNPSDKETTITLTSGPTYTLPGGLSGIKGSDAIGNSGGAGSPGFPGGQGRGGNGGLFSVSRMGENGQGTNPGTAGVVIDNEPESLGGGGGGSGGLGEQASQNFFKAIGLPLPIVYPAFRGGDGSFVSCCIALNGLPGQLFNQEPPIPGYGCGGNGGGGGGGAGAYPSGLSIPGPGGQPSPGGYGLIYISIESV